MMSEKLEDKSAKELLGKMMAIELFLVQSTCKVNPVELKLFLADHLRYMIGLEENGSLFASGPLVGPKGEITGNGVTVLRANSMKEADALAKEDPFYKANLRSYEIQKWIINEGRLIINVNLSNRSASAS